eukprot:s552_g42.t1
MIDPAQLSLLGGVGFTIPYHPCVRKIPSDDAVVAWNQDLGTKLLNQVLRHVLALTPQDALRCLRAAGQLPERARPPAAMVTITAEVSWKQFSNETRLSRILGDLVASGSRLRNRNFIIRDQNKTAPQDPRAMRTFCCAPILLALRIPFLPLACVHCAPLPESEAEVLDKPVQGDVASYIQVPNRASEARNFISLERYSDETNSLNSHTDLDVFCDDHWTSTGVAGFWNVSEKSDSLITWTIERGNKGGQVSSSWSRGTACEGGRIKKGTAVVVAQSTDRFSPNVWHQLAAMFMAWVTPQALEALEILPQNISVSYYVPDIGDESVEKNSGAFDWQMLGPVTSKRCNFEHDILSPGDGFMWDLGPSAEMRAVSRPLAGIPEGVVCWRGVKRG